MAENKSKKKIIIGISAIIAVCVGIGIFYFTRDTGEELDVNSEEVWELYAPFSYHLYDSSKEELYSADVMKPENLSNAYKNRLAYASYAFDNRDVPGKILEVKSSDLEKSFHKVVGKDEKYVPEVFDGFCISGFMTYDESTATYICEKEYTELSNHCYGQEIYKAVKYNDRIEIFQYVVVYGSKTNADYIDYYYGAFRTLEDADKFKNQIKESSDVADIIKNGKENPYTGWPEDDLHEYYNDAAQYKLTFEKEDDNYIFTEIERIK